MVGTSQRPYLEEAYDVTDRLRIGSMNLLVVRVDNTIPERGVPDRNWHGWWDDGGLIRPVYLEIRPGASSNSHVETKMAPGGAWQLNIDTDVLRANPRQPATVRYRLDDSGHRTVWKESRDVAASNTPGQQIHLSSLLQRVAPWSPERPVLYTLTTQTTSGGVTDTIQIRIGFRQIECRGTQILLNGQPYAIRGVSRHQFFAGSGMSPTVAQDRQDIKDIKELGANLVRLAHYSQSQDVYDACDELGLLVWTEIPAWQSSVESLSDAAVWRDAAEPQLRGMVDEYRNHPCVVIWSVANEIPSDTPAGAAYVAKAIAFVKSLDDSRLVTFASDRRVKDISFGPVDFIAINEYFGWYYGKQTDVGPMLDEMHRLFPDKPILVSEFGADSVAGWDPAIAPVGSRDYSYSAQVEFLKTHMKQIFAPERKSFVAGGLIWVYNDFPDPHRIGGDHPTAANFRNNKGIVTMDRTHKPAYEVVQRFFREDQDTKP
jgi:beta-galactosidase/beta-glucuronidase